MGATHLILAGILAVAGQGITPKPEPPASTEPGAELVPPAKNPYTRIFPAPRPDPSSPSLSITVPQNADVTPDLQPRIVCGMVVVPVKPDVDAKMVVRPPTGPQPDYKIRKISPRICNR